MKNTIVLSKTKEEFQDYLYRQYNERKGGNVWYFKNAEPEEWVVRQTPKYFKALWTDKIVLLSGRIPIKYMCDLKISILKNETLLTDKYNTIDADNWKILFK